VAFCLRSCLSGARRRKGEVDRRQLVVVEEGEPTVNEKLWQSAIVSHLQGTVVAGVLDEAYSRQLTRSAE
jgi:hypothetical protein